MTNNFEQVGVGGRLPKVFTVSREGKGPFIPSVSLKAVMTLVILFSLKAVESLENGLQTHLKRFHCFQ